ncbi:hypothetical protein J3L16_04875 [Alteromonas sp. 5E99-2]|uniref:hypothetical protein n=1 Tax=Alteromonas sp. 5E99-2 TaxID=2817683 RepID=UPI001A99D237|nr:hypothetical protein [Alteromonas sp. 5E99-2]MBO1255021.1 hypothetical protein [Alteromonas sp. 5E99-2]
MVKKKSLAQRNAEKQKRFRNKQKEEGKKLIRGYITPEAQDCYNDIIDKTQWKDSEVLSNALRLTYAAYKCGQIQLLTQWLKEQER